MKVDSRLIDALHLWSASVRSELSIGYPNQAAFAKEYQAGYRAEARIPSVSEIETLGSVERGIGELRRRFEIDRTDLRYLVIRERYGAYSDPPPERERREAAYKLCGSKNRYYRFLDAAHGYLEGFVHA